MQLMIGNRYLLWMVGLSSVVILQGIAISQEHLASPRLLPIFSHTEGFEFQGQADSLQGPSRYTLSIAGVSEPKRLDYRPEDYLPELSEDFSWESHADESAEAELEEILESAGSTQFSTESQQTEEPAQEKPLSETRIVHTVKPGETLSAIARLYDMTVSTLVLYNGLTNPNAIRPGFQLHLAFEQEFDHVVKAGESYASIAGTYRLSPEVLQQLNPTNTNLKPGDRIKVRVEDISERNIQRILAARGKGPRFVWPVKGRVTSEVGWRIHPITRAKRRHNGLDIAAPKGTPIHAANDGKVVFAGALNGYGRIVILEHSNGVTTRYAHCSRLLVERGQRVERGQKIAEVGSTGLSTAPHLHFEVRKMGKPLNPRDYL